MIRLLLLVAVFVVSSAPFLCFGETDYVARDLIKKMDKRLELVERGPTIRVQSTPGGTLTTIPGYTSLELLAAGSVSMTPTAPSSGVARVVVSSSGGVYDSSSPGDTTNYWARKNGGWIRFSPTEYPAYIHATNGVTIGTNVSVTLPGTLRWNPALTNLQVHNGAGWTNLASGTGGGTGSGFPLAADGDLKGFSLTNGSSLRATSGVFQSTSAGALTASGATLGTTTINGDLTVSGTRFENQVVTTTTGTNINIGVSTTYVYSVYYSTQILSLVTIVYTNYIATNQVDTYVNVGGSFTMGSNSTFDATNANVVKFPGLVSTNGTNGATTTITGTLDVTGATLVGISLEEFDPVFTNWLATNIPPVTAEIDPLSIHTDAIGVGLAIVSNKLVATGAGTAIVTNEVDPRRYDAYREYAPLVTGTNGVATIAPSNGLLWMKLDASDEPRSLAMGTGFNTNQTWRFYVKIGRGTNTFSVDTNLTGYAFLSLPVSSTNHILIDRYPGDASFRVLQVYR